MSPEDAADLLELIADPFVHAVAVQRTVEDAYPDAVKLHPSAWARWCASARENPEYLDRFRG